jgi:hypothetical protein
MLKTRTFLPSLLSRSLATRSSDDSELSLCRGFDSARRIKAERVSAMMMMDFIFDAEGLA